MTSGRLNPLVAVALSVAAVVIVVVVGWFAFVSPQRSKADRLDTQQAAVDGQIAADAALIAAPRRKQTQAELRAARTALPDTPEVSNILRELTRLATESRTEIDGISPGTAVVNGAAQSIPISLTFKGRYFGLQKLMKLLRQSADVRNGKLVATGRLYTVDSILFGTSEGGNLTATISLNTYVYGAPAAATTTPATTPTETTATSAGQ